MPKDEKRVPEVRFKGFTEDWEQRKLGGFVNITMGQSPKSENYTENPNDPILVQGNADIKNGWVSPRVWTTQVTKTANKGDIILSVRAPVGDVGKTQFDVVLGRGVAGIEGNEFTFQLLNQMNSNRFWTKYSTGSTFESINSNDLKGAVISAPKKIEQSQIGRFLFQLDNTLVLHQEKLNKLNLLYQGFMQIMFPKGNKKQPKLKFTNFTDEWEPFKLGEIGETYTGLSGKKKEDFGHGKAEFVNYLNVFNNHISDINLTEKIEVDEKQNEVKYGDVFFTTSSETPHEVGMSSVWLDNRPNVYLNSFCFGFRPHKELDSLFFAYLLRSLKVRKQFILLAQGISRYNISKYKAMEIVVDIPPIAEQQKIGKFFKLLDETIIYHQSKINKIRSLKKAYTQKMFV